MCVFSLPSLALRATLVGHEGIVRALAWGRGRLASGADDATVRFWQTSELKRPPQALLEATERKFAVTLRGTKLVPRVHFISMGLKSNTDWP